MKISAPSSSEAEVAELQALTDELLFWTKRQRERLCAVKFAVCWQCGQPFSSRAFGGQGIRRYCCVRCRDDYNHRVQAGKYKQTCQVCGVKFARQQRQKFCSHKCFGKSKEITHPCERCGEPQKNWQAGRGRKWCSRKCWMDAKAEFNAARLPPVRECLQCGAEYRVPKKKTKHCSKKCGQLTASLSRPRVNGRWGSAAQVDTRND